MKQKEEEGIPIFEGKNIIGCHTHGGQFNDNTIVINTEQRNYRLKVLELIPILSQLSYVVLPKKRKDQINIYLKPIIKTDKENILDVLNQVCDLLDVLVSPDNEEDQELKNKFIDLHNTLAQSEIIHSYLEMGG